MEFEDMIHALWQAVSEQDEEKLLSFSRRTPVFVGPIRMSVST